MSDEVRRMPGNYYPGFCRSEKKAVCQNVLGTPPFLLYLLMIHPIPILHYQLDQSFHSFFFGNVFQDTFFSFV